MDRGTKIVFSVITTIIIAFALNFVFGVIQDIYHKKDMQKYQTMENIYNQDKHNLDNVKNELEQTLNQIKIEEISLKTDKNNLFSQGDVDTYNSKVNELNSKIEDYERKKVSYNKDVEIFNIKTEELNNLHKKAYSRWIIIPGLRTH